LPWQLLHQCRSNGIACDVTSLPNPSTKHALHHLATVSTMAVRRACAVLPTAGVEVGAIFELRHHRATAEGPSTVTSVFLTIRMPTKDDGTELEVDLACTSTGTLSSASANACKMLLVGLASELF
jgi:hypothetical protein